MSQLALTYASLILYDDGQDITAEKLTALLKSAGVKVESYWPKIFAKAVSGRNFADFFNFGGASTSAPAAVSAPVAEKKADKKEDKKAKVVEQPKEEEEEVGMGGLFDWAMSYLTSIYWLVIKE